MRPARAWPCAVCPSVQRGDEPLPQHADAAGAVAGGKGLRHTRDRPLRHGRQRRRLCRRPLGPLAGQSRYCRGLARRARRLHLTSRRSPGRRPGRRMAAGEPEGESVVGRVAAGGRRQAIPDPVPASAHGGRHSTETTFPRKRSRRCVRCWPVATPSKWGATKSTPSWPRRSTPCAGRIVPPP